jgi:Origin recognition complex (ORC) subunit 5 C-terminus
MQVWTHLATLIQIGYIQRIGPYDKLDEIKLRCQCNLEYVEKLSRSVQFDIHAYLIEGQALW